MDSVDSFEDEIRRETRKGRFRFAELEEGEADWEKLQRWFARLIERDFFGAPGRAGAEEALARGRALLDGFTEEVYRAEGLDPGRPAVAPGADWSAGQRARAWTDGHRDRRPLRRTRREPAQDRRQDAALAVVVDLDRAVEAGDRPSNRRSRRRRRSRAHDRRAAARGARPAGEPVDRVRLAAGQPERRRALAGQELERQDAHPDEVGAVDPLVALGDDRPDPEQRRALGRPVARRARAVLAAGEDDERHALGRVAHRRVVDERLLAVGQVDRVRALLALDEPVAQADVAERARASSPRGGRAGRRTS